jgi:hypothetical protein
MKLIFIFLLIIIFVFIIMNNNYHEKFTVKKHYDCIISINVHEKFNFLLKQLENIKNNVSLNYAIILNCNDYMFTECTNNILPDNVYINNIILNKQRFHGSLTEGIYNNMIYALENFDFDFFIVSSSRNFFDNNMKLSDLKTIVKGKPYREHIPLTTWHWPSFLKTKLAKYFIDQNKELYNSPHEGLLFTFNAVKIIVSFLESNIEIKQDLFNFNNCVEEFGLQTIVTNMGEQFFYIGNGISNDRIKPNDQNEYLKFMYKENRDLF